jgi:DNA-binding NtrC family response regulator
MAKILIIDDDSKIREIIHQVLEREGHEVVDASDGKEGITLYRNSPADLIITDIIMPEKGGFETIHELKNDYPDVKIIAISGGRRVEPGEYLQLAQRFGAFKTLQKPFKMEELVEAVEEVLHMD